MTSEIGGCWAEAAGRLRWNNIKGCDAQRRKWSGCLLHIWYNWGAEIFSCVCVCSKWRICLMQYNGRRQQLWEKKRKLCIFKKQEAASEMLAGYIDDVVGSSWSVSHQCYVLHVHYYTGISQQHTKGHVWNLLHVKVISFLKSWTLIPLPCITWLFATLKGLDLGSMQVR